eukprot:TRINITY_DN23141_c0_g3_i2.p1 TRINITY_DN23141_c0_g3~~TRINITY_DN23141_c0_g3_i2.p1  ORF type:complete len:360 (-),score=58.07 TRINITY_DN23141_c0_g3_i2:287-1366(-)
MLVLSGAAPETYGAWSVLGISLLCIVIYSCKLIASVRTSLPRSRCACWRSAIAPRWEAVVECLKQYWTSKTKETARERKVRRLAAKARLERFMSFVNVVVHVTAALAAYTIAAMGYYDLALFRDVDRARWELHQSSFVNLTLCFIFGLFSWIFPKWTTLTTPHIYHFLLFARLCWQASTCATIYEAINLELFTVGMRFLGVIFLGTPSSTLGLNIVYAFLKLRSYMSLFACLDDAEQALVLEFWGSSAVVMASELFATAGAWCASLSAENWSYATVRANLQATAATTSEETVKSILVVMCDAVVTVDQDLCFKSSANPLAHFLVSHTPHANSAKNQRMSLLDFVEDLDRSRISGKSPRA